MAKCKPLRNPHYPEKLYAAWREYANEDMPTLSADPEPTGLVTDIGEDIRVAVYQLVGYVNVQNHSTTSEFEPLKRK